MGRKLYKRPQVYYLNFEIRIEKFYGIYGYTTRVANFVIFIFIF